MTFSKILKLEDRFAKLGLELLSRADKNIHLWTWGISPDFQVNQTRILFCSFAKSVLAVFTVVLLDSSSCCSVCLMRVQDYPHQENPASSISLFAVTEVCSTLFLDASGFLAVANRIYNFSINRKPLCSYPSSLDFWKLTTDINVKCFRSENPERWLFCTEATSTKATTEHLRFALATAFPPLNYKTQITLPPLVLNKLTSTPPWWTIRVRWVSHRWNSHGAPQDLLNQTPS